MHEVTIVQQSQLSHSIEWISHKDSPGRGAGETLTHSKQTLSGFGDNTRVMQSRYLTEPHGQMHCPQCGMATALLDYDETQQVAPAPTALEPSKGCLAGCSSPFIGSTKLVETTLGKNGSPGFCFSVAGEEDVQRDTISKESEEREYTTLACLKGKSQSSQNPCFSPHLIRGHHVNLIKIFKRHLQI